MKLKNDEFLKIVTAFYLGLELEGKELFPVLEIVPFEENDDVIIDKNNETYHFIFNDVVYIGGDISEEIYDYKMSVNDYEKIIKNERFDEVYKDFLKIKELRDKYDREQRLVLENFEDKVFFKKQMQEVLKIEIKTNNYKEKYL